MTPTHLIWLDVETTGLNPNVDWLLEVSAYVAPFVDPFKNEKLYHAVLRCRDQSNVSDVVAEMHAKSGLWAECIASSTDLAKVQRDLVEAMVSLAPRPDKGMCVLAGFSVHFDLGFVRAKLPEFSQYLSHKVYDVSAVKLFCQSMGMPESKFPKQSAHRTEEDVLESIAHAIACQEWLDDKKGVL